jgi:hypothetical protein
MEERPGELEIGNDEVAAILGMIRLLRGFHRLDGTQLLKEWGEEFAKNIES